MKSSAEISMYPLDPHYGTPILRFIDRLKSYDGLKVKTNNMSTQVFGEYQEMMAILTTEMKKSFEEEEAVVMVLKIANLDLR